uniref:Ion_trans_2 domain-containing protein n=1 Tax=Angiostrongylus cantonensis TaxID=6313 RepID=A0A0K0D605_ANGCA
MLRSPAFPSSSPAKSRPIPGSTTFLVSSYQAHGGKSPSDPYRRRMSFIHGLFFSFNTITTIGLGNIYVRSHFYLALVVVYVIIGLAVITASLDLCSSTLKRTFTKLHYFGRKIRGARRGFANMSDDIREAMRIIAALKKTRPSKDRITLEDLKRFLEVQEHLLRQPYVPYNVHLMRWIEDNVGQQMASFISPTYCSFLYIDDNITNSKKSQHQRLLFTNLYRW